MPSQQVRVNEKPPSGLILSDFDSHAALALFGKSRTFLHSPCRTWPVSFRHVFLNSSALLVCWCRFRVLSDIDGEIVRSAIATLRESVAEYGALSKATLNTYLKHARQYTRGLCIADRFRRTRSPRFVRWR